MSFFTIHHKLITNNTSMEWIDNTPKTNVLIQHHSLQSKHKQPTCYN